MDINIGQLQGVVEEGLSLGAGKLESKHKEAVHHTIYGLHHGLLRAAQPMEDGTWQVNSWVKGAILLYFGLNQSEVIHGGDLQFYDKIPLRQDYEEAQVRAVPPGIARYGAYLGKGVILMPGYVNIGAYVGAGSMIDTWATVGSCAQIGEGVHLSGGVGIGGVLEPLQASPVIVEDGAFIGSRCVVVEGVHVGKEAVLGAGVVLTSSSPIVDVRGNEPIISRGRIPARAVVIPGSMDKKFAAGTFGVPCALIIGDRTESTDRKTSLNDVLRTYNVAL